MDIPKHSNFQPRRDKTLLSFTVMLGMLRRMDYYGS